MKKEREIAELEKLLSSAHKMIQSEKDEIVQCGCNLFVQTSIALSLAQISKTLDIHNSEFKRFTGIVSNGIESIVEEL